MKTFRNRYQVNEFTLIVTVDYTDPNTVSVRARCNELTPRYVSDYESNSATIVETIGKAQNDFQQYIQNLELQKESYFESLMKALQFREVVQK